MPTPKLLALALCSVAAIAAAPPAEDGAIVFHDGPCAFRRGGFPRIQATEVHSVITPSGNASLSCHGQLPPGTEPETTVAFDLGGDCLIGIPGVGLVTATQGHLIYTPSGRANLLCQYKAAD